MSQSPVNVTYSIEEILKEITQKLEKLGDKIDHLTVEMATVKTKIEGVENDIKDIKGSQKAQI